MSLRNLRLRYKQPTRDDSQLLEYPILQELDSSQRRRLSTDFRFAASVAAFGQLLRGGNTSADFDFDDVETLARVRLPRTSEGYRREFVSLVRLAELDELLRKPEQVSDIAR